MGAALKKQKTNKKKKKREREREMGLMCKDGVRRADTRAEDKLLNTSEGGLGEKEDRGQDCEECPLSGR